MIPSTILGRCSEAILVFTTILEIGIELRLSNSSCQIIELELLLVDYFQLHGVVGASRCVSGFCCRQPLSGRGVRRADTSLMVQEHFLEDMEDGGELWERFLPVPLCSRAERMEVRFNDLM